MANEAMRTYWSGAGADGWVANRRLFDHELAAFGEAVVATLDPGPDGIVPRG